MIKFGLVNFFGLSVPEEYLLLILTMLVIGFKDILNFKNKENLVKVIFVTLMTALFTSIGHNYFDQIAFLGIIQIIFFVFIYSIVFKKEWYGIVLSFLIVTFIYLIFDFAGIILVASFMKINYMDIIEKYSNTPKFILITLPSRLFLIITCFIVYKLPFTIINSCKIEDFTKNTIKKISLPNIKMFVILILIVDKIQMLLQNFNPQNVKSMIYLYIGLILTSGLFVMSFIDVKKTNDEINRHTKDKKHILNTVINILEESKDNTIAIEHIKEIQKDYIRSDFK